MQIIIATRAPGDLTVKEAKFNAYGPGRDFVDFVLQMEIAL